MSATLLLLAAALGTADAGCDEAEAFVARAEQAVLEERLDDAAGALRDAEVAFSCGPLAEPDLLVRFWLAQGARETRLGDVRAAAVSFRAAATLAPDHWPIDYGIKSFIQYKAASELWLGEGNIQLHPAPEGRIAALDGVVTSFPVTTLEGLHLVQVGQSVEAMEFASLVTVQSAEPTMVLTGLEPLVDGVAVAAPVPEPKPTLRMRGVERHGLRVGALVVGGTAAVMAGGGALLARAQDDVMREQTTQALLDAEYARQQRYAAITWSLAGVSAVGITLHFAL